MLRNNLSVRICSRNVGPLFAALVPPDYIISMKFERTEPTKKVLNIADNIINRKIVFDY